MAADPGAALAGLAAILDHSSRVHRAQNSTLKAQRLEQIASETAARVAAVAALHPQIQLTSEQLVPQAAAALPKGALRNEFGP